MLKLMCIGLGGFLGAISRYSISKWVETRWEVVLPYGTLIVNITGSFLLGLIMTLFMEKGIEYPYLKTAITTGFLGALTTFSTFGYETMMLFEDKEFILAGVNVFANLIFGLIFVMLGILIGKTI